MESQHRLEVRPTSTDKSEKTAICSSSLLSSVSLLLPSVLLLLSFSVFSPLRAPVKPRRRFATSQNTAEDASKKPDETGKLAERVQRYPAASEIDLAHADAILLQTQGKFEEAVEKWRVIADVVGEEDPQLRARTWFSIGYLLSEGEGGGREPVIDAYTKAIELNPNYVSAYNNRGTAKSQLGRHEEALADYDRAIELNPTLAETYSNRGARRMVSAATKRPWRITTGPSN